jgi:Flp pilus assembly pilin Flp
MIFLKKNTFRYPESSPAAEKSNRGAITVEYALCMGVAAVFMVGVELMFRGLAIDVINVFKQMVTQFPNI